MLFVVIWCQNQHNQKRHHTKKEQQIQKQQPHRLPPAAHYHRHQHQQQQPRRRPPPPPQQQQQHDAFRQEQNVLHQPNKKSYHNKVKSTLLYFIIILLGFISPSVSLAKDTESDQYRVKHCDNVLNSSTSKNGSIKSPMFPGTYPQKTLCRYDFQGKDRERIQIVFSEFALPSEGDPEICDIADTLKIYFPMRNRFENVETLCGDIMPKSIMSNGPRMRIEFRGDRGGKGRGFKADYSFLENFGIKSGRQVTDEYCSFAFNATEAASGWFNSPNYPGAYPRNIECNYYFHGGLNDRVVIRFNYFDIEGVPPCDEYTASDYVEFSNFMTTDRKFMRHCGQIRDFSVRSDGKFFRITFHSNDRLDGTGFKAFYKFEMERPTTEIIPLDMDISMAHTLKSHSACYTYYYIVTIAALLNCFKLRYIIL